MPHHDKWVEQLFTLLALHTAAIGERIVNYKYFKYKCFNIWSVARAFKDGTCCAGFTAKDDSSRKIIQNTHDQSRTKVQGKLGDSNEVHWW